jgi:glucose-1-phosphate thymidylyltransferase
VNRDGFLEDIVEKPDDRTFEELGEQSLVSMNLWSFPPAIFDACEQITPSRRGELELPDAVRYAMRNLGVPFRVLPCALGVLDLSNRADIAAVGERLRAVQVRL